MNQDGVTSTGHLEHISNHFILHPSQEKHTFCKIFKTVYRASCAQVSVSIFQCDGCWTPLDVCNTVTPNDSGLRSGVITTNWCPGKWISSPGLWLVSGGLRGFWLAHSLHLKSATHLRDEVSCNCIWWWRLCASLLWYQSIQKVNMELGTN